jgi:hypothetical protein
MALIITRCLWSSAKFTFFLKKKEVCCPLFWWLAKTCSVT